ncbi:MAG TPA: GNAT family N-acetyltransferase [Candidatus Acidoferrum sp.]|nr:GNAT family N-acetyltransferase [Candidatus Acidoferrum sp.]
MKAGTVLREFLARDKRRVILRTPRWDDLDDLLEMINSLVAEGADIVISEKVSRVEEIDWLARALSHLAKDEILYLVAEVDGKVVANSEISMRRDGYDGHVGGIGIAIREGYRDVGIGTEMMKTLLEQARKIGLKVLTLFTFESNRRAIHVYENVGFVQTGKIPRKFFREGKYIDEVIMTLVLE